MTNQFILSPFALDQRAPLMDRLAAPDWTVNAPSLSGDSMMARMRGVHEPLAEAVARTVAAGQRAVSVGGDCCQTIAVAAGLRRAGLDPVVVWFDAHGDFNTWDTSPSGYIAGMALAMLVGRGELTLLQQLDLAPLAETRCILSDARDLDPGERASLQASAVTHVGIEQLLERLPADKPLYVHFDVDVIDAADAPASFFPVSGGPSADTMRSLARQLRETGRLVAVSVTPWRLDHPETPRTEQVCLEILDALTNDR